MAEKPSKEHASRLSQGERESLDDDRFFDQAFEDFGDTIADGFLFQFLGLGLKERMTKLSKILARCKQEDDCLVWQGPHSGEGRGGGYGRFSFGGTTSAVHLVMYAIVYGPIPSKKQIDHTCNNRLCCMPSHLVCVTRKKNQHLRSIRRKERDK